eukprot:scaffold2062_cov181-Ochromonas_danica.AAC.5
MNQKQKAEIICCRMVQNLLHGYKFSFSVQKLATFLYRFYVAHRQQAFLQFLPVVHLTVGAPPVKNGPQVLDGIQVCEIGIELSTLTDASRNQSFKPWTSSRFQRFLFHLTIHLPSSNESFSTFSIQAAPSTNPERQSKIPFQIDVGFAENSIFGRRSVLFFVQLYGVATTSSNWTIPQPEWTKI